jgi:hypothetical protein
VCVGSFTRSNVQRFSFGNQLSQVSVLPIKNWDLEWLFYVEEDTTKKKTCSDDEIFFAFVL